MPTVIILAEMTDNYSNFVTQGIIIAYKSDGNYTEINRLPVTPEDFGSRHMY